MELRELLNFLVTSEGINAALGVILSVVAFYWPEYQKLEHRAKVTAFAGLAALVPVLALVAQVALGYVDVASGQALVEQHLYPAAVSVFTAIATGTVFHGLVLKSRQ